MHGQMCIYQFRSDVGFIDSYEISFRLSTETLSISLTFSFISSFNIMVEPLSLSFILFMNDKRNCNHCILIVSYGFLILVYLQLSGSDCKKYSVNNRGPCLNGGKINDCGEELAADITCLCPPNFSGRFCQYENVTVSKQVFTKI